MAVTGHWYGPAVLGQWSGDPDRIVDFASDTIMVALLEASYTPDIDTHKWFSDVNFDQAEGLNYTPGGKALTTTSLVWDSATNTLRFDGDDIEWEEVTIAAQYAVIYKVGTEPGDSPLMAYLDFGKVEEVTAGVLRIGWDAVDRVMRVVAA